MLCQNADNTNLCPAIDRKLRVPHVACQSHSVSLALKEMEANDPELKRLIKEVQECHRTIKASNNLSAALANVQQSAHECVPKLMAKTRWNSVTDMLNSHVNLSDEIRDISKKFDDKISDYTVKAMTSSTAL